MFDYKVETGQIWIYDHITGPGHGGIDAGSVVAALEDIGDKPVTVRLNSPGGDVDEGIAIYNALARHGNVTTVNDSLAASIANYVFMAGKRRLVAPNSRSMIHEPWTIAAGTSGDLRKLADQLDNARGVIRQVYVEKLKAGESKVDQLMADETWFTAKEAVSAGMATGTSTADAQPIKIAASLFKKTPEQFIQPLAAGALTKATPIRDKFQREQERIHADLTGIL